MSGPPASDSNKISFLISLLSGEMAIAHCGPSQGGDWYSTEAAVELASVSRRTLWRRVQEGKVGRAGLDVRGRALLVLDDLRALLAIRLEDEADARLLVDADQGSSEAQNELGILCLEQSQPLLAVYWFNQAAEQGHADAMYHLSRLYLHGFDQLGGGLLGAKRQRGLCLAV